MNEIRTKWYGWIPTNRGKINFDFIGLPKNLKSQNVTKHYADNKIKFTNLDVSYLSDSYTYRFRYYPLKVEHVAIANLEFEHSSNKIQGNVEIIYKDFCKLSSKFICELNGIVEFENISYERYSDLDSDLDSIEDVLQEIKSLLYVLVKTVIHGDAHHHQKIDVALPIINDKFNPTEVSSSLLDYIKLVERNVKNLNDCASFFRNENLVFEINGYLSYFKSFTLLFEDEAIKKNYDFAQSVAESLKSTVAKRKNKAEYESNIKTAIITFIGLFISTNLLVNGFWPTNNNITDYLEGENRLVYLGVSAILILYLFYKYISCKLSSYLHHSKYDFFEFSSLIKNADFSRLNTIGKVYRLSPLIIATIAFLIFLFSRMQDVSYV